MSQEGSKQLFWSDSRYKLEYVDVGKFYARMDFYPDSTCTFKVKINFQNLIQLLCFKLISC